MDSVNVRNLDQIQESDGHPKAGKWSALLLASIGGAALVLAAVMTLKRSEPPARSSADPLAALVAQAKRGDGPAAEDVAPKESTFPSILSDGQQPTTALAVVKDERGQLVKHDAQPVTPPESAKPAANQLPAVPLPVGTLLAATPVTTQPKDGLTELAKDVSRIDQTTAPPPGSEGGYQIQVASFKDQLEADQFVEELRRRGHRAYRQAAYVADRGLWHRVRIGPYQTKYAAQQYQKEFEKKERMSTFLVDPDKVKRQEELRAAKLAQRIQKFGKE